MNTVTSRFASAVGDFLYPLHEPADPCVYTGIGGVATTVTPGDDSCKHPVATVALAHQWPPTVTLTTVHTTMVRQAAGTQHAAGEATAVAFFTLPRGQQWDPGLQQCSGILRV